MNIRTICWLGTLALALGEAGASPLFDDAATLRVTLTGPVSTLTKDLSDKTERAFVLHVDGVELAVDVRVRGNSRLRVCGFPPLRLNFDKQRVAGTVFAGQDKLKLVTHCRTSDAAEQNVLEEFAAYGIFNRISDISYRVRLLHIRYVDTIKDSSTERYAFLIETDDAVAERTGGEIAKLPGVRLSELAQTHAASVYVFQYLIGNTDWSLVTADGDVNCCHNGDLLRIGGELYYLPYDFDLAGIVNASYARPDPSLRISSVRKRRYRGYCLASESLEAGLDRVMSRQSEIIAFADALPALTERNRKSMHSYLERFFAEASERERLLASFERRCL